MTIAGLWRYGDWRHVATGCTALVLLKCINVVHRDIWQARQGIAKNIAGCFKQQQINQFISAAGSWPMVKQ